MAPRPSLRIHHTAWARPGSKGTDGTVAGGAPREKGSMGLLRRELLALRFTGPEPGALPGSVPARGVGASTVTCDQGGGIWVRAGDGCGEGRGGWRCEKGWGVGVRREGPQLRTQPCQQG